MQAGGGALWKQIIKIIGSQRNIERYSKQLIFLKTPLCVHEITTLAFSAQCTFAAFRPKLLISFTINTLFTEKTK